MGCSTSNVYNDKNNTILSDKNSVILSNEKKLFSFNSSKLFKLNETIGGVFDEILNIITKSYIECGNINVDLLGTNEKTDKITIETKNGNCYFTFMKNDEIIFNNKTIITTCGLFDISIYIRNYGDISGDHDEHKCYLREFNKNIIIITSPNDNTKEYCYNIFNGLVIYINDTLIKLYDKLININDKKKIYKEKNKKNNEEMKKICEAKMSIFEPWISTYNIMINMKDYINNNKILLNDVKVFDNDAILFKYMQNIIKNYNDLYQNIDETDMISKLIVDDKDLIEMVYICQLCLIKYIDQPANLRIECFLQRDMFKNIDIIKLINKKQLVKFEDDIKNNDKLIDDATEEMLNIVYEYTGLKKIKDISMISK